MNVEALGKIKFVLREDPHPHDLALAYKQHGTLTEPSRWMWKRAHSWECQDGPPQDYFPLCRCFFIHLCGFPLLSICQSKVAHGHQGVRVVLPPRPISLCQQSPVTIYDQGDVNRSTSLFKGGYAKRHLALGSCHPDTKSGLTFSNRALSAETMCR